MEGYKVERSCQDAFEGALLRSGLTGGASAVPSSVGIAIATKKRAKNFSKFKNFLGLAADTSGQTDHYVLDSFFVTSMPAWLYFVDHQLASG